MTSGASRSARRAPQRQTGQREAVEDVEVVGLERDREGEHVEVAERAVALERAQRARPVPRGPSGRKARSTGDPRVVGQDA